MLLVRLAAQIIDSMVVVVVWKRDKWGSTLLFSLWTNTIIIIIQHIIRRFGTESASYCDDHHSFNLDAIVHADLNAFFSRGN